MADAAREVFDWLDKQPVSSRAKYTSGLVVEEIVGNVVKYGYDDDREHLVRFSIALLPDSIRFVFEDDGKPFDPTRYPPPDLERVVQSTKGGGLGIELVRKVSSSVEYLRDGDRNRTTLFIRRLEPGDTQPIRLTQPPPGDAP